MWVIPKFLWRDLGKPRKTSDRLVGIKAEIRKGVLQNKSEKPDVFLSTFIYDLTNEIHSHWKTNFAWRHPYSTAMPGDFWFLPKMIYFMDTLSINQKCTDDESSPEWRTHN